MKKDYLIKPIPTMDNIETKVVLVGGKVHSLEGKLPEGVSITPIQTMDDVKTQLVIVNAEVPKNIPQSRLTDAPILVVEKTPVDKTNIEEAITNICKMRDTEQMNKKAYKKK